MIREIKLVTRKDYLPFMLDIHYAKRIPSVSYSYGLSIINTHLNSGASIVLTSKTLLDNLQQNLPNKLNEISKPPSQRSTTPSDDTIKQRG